MAIFKFDTLLPKPNIKPINDKIKFVFVKTILKASPQVHLAYLVGWYTAPLFFVALFNNVSGLHSSAVTHSNVYLPSYLVFSLHYNN